MRKRSVCPGCGYYWAVYAEHRADCTAPAVDRERLAAEEARREGK